MVKLARKQDSTAETSWTSQCSILAPCQRMYLRMGFTQAPEQAALQALLSGCRILDQRGELVVVPHEAECLRPHDGAQHSGQCDLPGLIHDAHVKHAALQQGMRRAEACTANLKSHSTSISSQALCNRDDSLCTGLSGFCRVISASCQLGQNRTCRPHRFGIVRGRDRRGRS